MLYGATLPYRFNERKDSQGRLTYSAITSVHYFGEWAFASGLSDRLQPSWVHAFIKELEPMGVTRLHYYRKGKIVIQEL
jgi:hypothetical protein